MLKPHFSIATIYRLILMILLASGGASDRLQAAEIDPSQVPSATGQSIQTGSPQPTEIYVFGEQPVSTATEASVRQKDFELRPTGTPVDILTSSVPGLYTVQHQGGGKADEYLIRGFDADHGTDFAIFVDGIPVNLPNNAHGQGYADLHWLIPEIVDHIDVTKGPYFVQYGDFATAGAVNILTNRRPADSIASILGGSYSLQRYLTILSPPEGMLFQPYVAFEAYHERGPFKDPLGYNRYNLFTKFNLFSTANSNLSFLGTFHHSYWNASGGHRVLVGHVQEPIETVKAEGSNRSLKSKREQFAKGLIGVSGDDDGYKKASGQKLETVPESNVMKTRVGEEITLKILLDGKPLKSQVYTTYDGFSRRSMTFASATESLDDGFAYVKVTSPGVSMVRVEKRIEANARDFDLLSLKATLVFSVQ